MGSLSWHNSREDFSPPLPCQEKAEPCAPCPEQLDLTLEQLRKYTGQDGGRILMSVGGWDAPLGSIFPMMFPGDVKRFYLSQRDLYFLFHNPRRFPRPPP